MHILGHEFQIGIDFVRVRLEIGKQFKIVKLVNSFIPDHGFSIRFQTSPLI